MDLDKNNTQIINDDVNYGRTISGAELARLQMASKFDEPDGKSIYGYFSDRRIIGHDTTINGGVYIGGGSREAIVVDDGSHKSTLGQLDKFAYDRVYNAVLGKAQDRITIENLSFKDGILSDVYDVVRETINYDADYASKMAKDHLKQKINLSVFIDAQKGVCRHQALLAGYLLERLAREGYIKGTASVQRNAIKGVGAHAWVRYENTAGDQIILDPTQGYIGYLEDAPEYGWIYRRPEDDQNLQ